MPGPVLGAVNKTGAPPARSSRPGGGGLVRAGFTHKVTLNVNRIEGGEA